MSGRDQLGFAEAFMSAGLGTNRKLERLDGLIDWSALERLATPVREGRRGRPPYAPLSMLKALYLQALYDLSDPGLEEMLLDRLSFRRFCGFALDGGTPDETTICRFRADAGAVLEAAFEEINRQLDAAGLILRKGTLMDATLVAAASRPPPYKAGAGAGSAREPGADWTRKKGRAFFGYKAHLGVDQGSGLIRRVVLSSAKTYESEVADRLICGDEGAVYGDRAYEQQARRARLKAAGIKDRIMHRRNKHMASLPSWQKRRNDLIARRRAPGRGRLLGAEAPLRAAAGQEPHPRAEHRPPLRRRHRLQHAPRQPARRRLRRKRSANPRGKAAVEPTPQHERPMHAGKRRRLPPIRSTEPAHRPRSTHRAAIPLPPNQLPRFRRGILQGGEGQGEVGMMRCVGLEAIARGQQTLL